LFATGVVDTDGNLPPAPLTPVIFATGIIETGGKFITGINNTIALEAKFFDGVVDTGGAP
jgi:hypothetical protein